MTHRVTYRPLAVAEIDEACAWYDEQQSGLGDAFRNALSVLIWRIAEAPLSFPRVDGETRRAIVLRFRYAVYFRLHGDDVIIIAVVHSSRHPGRWQGRS